MPLPPAPAPMLRTLALAALLLPLAAQAQKPLPGLWEMTMNLQSGGADLGAGLAQMREQMARMPPEQRKMMEDMMAKQGVALNPGGAGGMNVRFCMSKEQAESDDVPQDADGNCKRDSLKRSGSTLHFTFTCSKPPSKGSGEVVFTSNKAYTMKVQMDRSEKGKTQRVDLQQSAKWLAADCGTLKPR